jgi:hypothetical protein
MQMETKTTNKHLVNILTLKILKLLLSTKFNQPPSVLLLQIKEEVLVLELTIFQSKKIAGYLHFQLPNN